MKRLHEHVFGVRRLRAGLVEQIDVNMSDLIPGRFCRPEPKTQLFLPYLSHHSLARPFKICDISFTRCATPFLSSSVSLSNLRASSC